MNKAIRIGRIRTSSIELIDITKAWLALSFAFAVVFAGFSLFSGQIYGIFSLSFGKYFIMALLTAGLGFLLHELSHKFVAQHYGCVAEFRAFDQMIYLAVGLALAVGFIFAAPGAVMLSGMITRRENGIISAAGPLMNYVLGLIFLGLMFLSIGYPTLRLAFAIGFQINMWLGLFNMIPFGNFDGIKIFNWSIPLWTAMVAFGVFFVFFF
ncbi:metalloprotease [Candidatus Woesearchaeota archaeon]|nr:metalloprotease [Candidatus Woesearchaeota archaeon]